MEERQKETSAHDCSRRKFLKNTCLAAGAVTMATVGYTPKASAKKEAVRLGMVIDLRKCFGCHACSVACKASFDVPLGHWRSWVNYMEEGKYPKAQRSFLPRLCNQCENPPCVEVCPVDPKATFPRKDGIVMQSDERCIGCGLCLEACPYKVRFINPKTETARKCDFCAHRVDQGFIPSCVDTCNAKARIFGNLNDPNSEVSKMITKHKAKALRTDQGTEPRVYYIGLEQFSYSSPNQKDEILKTLS